MDNDSHEVRVKVDNFFKKKEPALGKGVLVEAYEAMNTYNRVKERDLLNKEREAAFEKNRPPSKGWYELKDKRFTNEFHRNTVALKPNN